MFQFSLLRSNNATIIGGGGLPAASKPRNQTTGGSAFSSSSFATAQSHDLKPANGGFASLRDEPITQRARVLYDYEASLSDELSLTADEVITTLHFVHQSLF